MVAWVEQYKDGTGSVPVEWLLDGVKPGDKMPQAIENMPKIAEYLMPIVEAREALFDGHPIPNTEIDSYLSDYPIVDRARFKALVRVYDKAIKRAQ